MPWSKIGTLPFGVALVLGLILNGGTLYLLGTLLGMLLDTLRSRH